MGTFHWQLKCQQKQGSGNANGEAADGEKDPIDPSGHHQLRRGHQQHRSMATCHTAIAASGNVTAGSDDRELLGLYPKLAH